MHVRCLYVFSETNKGHILNSYSTDFEANALKRMFMSFEKHSISIFQIKQFKTAHPTFTQIVAF